jgi:hypothetical protein
MSLKFFDASSHVKMQICYIHYWWRLLKKLVPNMLKMHVLFCIFMGFLLSPSTTRSLEFSGQLQVAGENLEAMHLVLSCSSINLVGGPKHDTWQGKGVNEHKGETPYLERCHVALKLHLAWSKAHLMLNTLFKEVARAC